MNFSDLIHEFGELLGESFTPYQNRMIRFLINENLRVQIEMDLMGEFVMLACFITEIPPGRFRENVLRDALKANFLLDEHWSTLCYEGKENHLVLFFKIPAHGLTGQKLLDQLLPFVARAGLWRDAIDNGHTAPIGKGEIPEAKRKKSLPF
jgi:hypothetical protein